MKYPLGHTVSTSIKRARSPIRFFNCVRSVRNLGLTRATQNCTRSIKGIVRASDVVRENNCGIRRPRFAASFLLRPTAPQFPRSESSCRLDLFPSPLLERSLTYSEILNQSRGINARHALISSLICKKKINEKRKLSADVQVWGPQIGNRPLSPWNARNPLPLKL